MKTLSTSQDILDSRDIDKRIHQLEADKDTAALADLIVNNKEPDEISDEETVGDYDDACELAIWRNLREECDSSAWTYGIAFIADTYFEEYAQELAEDIGAIDRNMNWPATHIDWETAARDLQIDYTSVEIDGNEYWYRQV